jgi:ABC-type molybdate transport system substrate-binding protein
MAELVVFSTIGVRSAAEPLFTQFDKASHKLAVTWGTAPMLVKRIEGGDTTDVVVLSRASIDTLQKQGKIAPGSDVALASSGVGIAVKAGAASASRSKPARRSLTFPRPRRSSVRYSLPNRSPTANRRPAVPVAFISQNCSNGWASQNR